MRSDLLLSLVAVSIHSVSAAFEGQSMFDHELGAAARFFANSTSCKRKMNNRNVRESQLFGP
jgi:hypothetical protein